MASEIDVLRNQFAEATRRAETLERRYASDQLLARPSSKSWSVGELIQHLTNTNYQYVPLIDAALKQAGARKSTDAFRMDLRGKILRWSMEPPFRVKAKTLPAFEPGSIVADRILPDFRASQESILKRLHRSESAAIDTVQITSPFSKLMKYNLYSCFHILVTHQRRHLWQAETILHHRS